MNSPYFSVVVPVFNEENYIENILHALKRQTFTNFEIIISDNKSTDNSLRKIKKFQNNNVLNIKIVKCKQRGISYARNKGAKHANGKYLVFFDADGIPKNTWLENAHSITTINNNLFAISGTYIYHPTNSFIKTIFYNSYLPVLYLLILIKNILLRKNNLIGNNFLIRKDIFNKLKGFPHVIHEDIALSEKFNKKYKQKSKLSFKLINRYSPRRFEKHGYLRTLLEWLKSAVKRRSCREYETYR